MRSIDDWYMDRAHRDDLDPGYDFANDDVRDRLQFGKLPPREWIARPERNQPPATAVTKPTGRNKLPPPPTATRGRRPTAPAVPRWEVFVRSWLTRHPNASIPQCRAAAHKAGFTKVSKRSIGAVRLAMVRESVERQVQRVKDQQEAARAREEQSRTARRIEQKRAAARRDCEQAAEAIARAKAADHQRAFLRRWLINHPTDSDAACREAADRAGFGKVTEKAIAEVRAALRPGHDIGEPRVWEQDRFARRVEQKRAAARRASEQTAQALARPIAAEQQRVLLRRWLINHPTDSDTACREAAQRAGFGKVTEKTIADVRAGLRPGHDVGQPTARVTEPKRKQRTRVVRVQSAPDVGPRCPACDMVPDRMTGHCRCS